MKPLSKTNEELIVLAKSGDIKAYNELLEYNSRLAYHIAGKFENTGIETEELAGYGLVGLMKAYHTFDVEKGIKFATYASRCIENDILMFLRKNKRHLGVQSLDAIISTDWEGNDLTITDIISTGEDIATEYEDADTATYLKNAISQLPDKYREVAIRCIMMNENQREVADSLGLSQSYISRLVKRATLILKQYIKTGVLTTKNPNSMEYAPAPPAIREDDKVELSIAQLKYVLSKFPQASLPLLTRIHRASPSKISEARKEIEEGLHGGVEPEPFDLGRFEKLLLDEVRPEMVEYKVEPSPAPPPPQPKPKESVDMKINLGHLLYIIKTYPNYNAREVSEILGVSVPLISVRAKELRDGKHSDIQPDSSIEPKLTKYLPNWTADRTGRKPTARNIQPAEEKSQTIVETHYGTPQKADEPSGNIVETTSPVIAAPVITTALPVHDKVLFRVHLQGASRSFVDSTLDEVRRLIATDDTYTLSISLNRG